MANKNADILKFNTPAGWWGEKWREGLYLGNGKIGANVFGGASEEKILINDAALDWMGRTTVVPDISQGLQTVRQLVNNGEFMRAQQVIPNLLTERDFRPQAEYPLPLCEISVQFSQKEITSNYCRTLDMARGETTVTYNVGDTVYTRQTFVSRADDIVVMRFSKKGDGAINAKITIDLPHRVNARTYEGVCPMPTESQFKCEKPFMYFSVHHDEKVTDYGVVAKVSNLGGSLRVEENKLVISNAQSVTIILKTFVNIKYDRAFAELKLLLASIRDGYDKLFKTHAHMHNKLYATGDLCLSDQDGYVEDLLNFDGNNLPPLLAEKLYKFARYLLVAGTTDDGVALSPTGLWNGGYKSYRAFRYHDGILQMTYLHALQGNMFANIEKTFDFYEQNMDDFRNNAQRLFNCRGIFVPTVCAPNTGRLGSKDLFALHFTGCGAWLSNFYYRYAKTSQNTKFEKRILPFMKEVAKFYCDFIQMENGKVVFNPSAMPMRIADGYKITDRPVVSKTSALDCALAREFFTNLIEICRNQGVKGDFVTWNNILDSIPQPQISGDGTLREFVDSLVSVDYTGISVGTLYPAYFGNQVSWLSDQDTIDRYLATADKKRSLPASQNSYYMAILGAVYARLGNAEKAKICLSNIVRGCAMNNLVFVDKDWRGMGICGSGVWTPVQLHTNMVFAHDLQQMLMYSCGDTVKIFPALPKEWKHVCFQNFITQNGVMVSCDYNQSKASLKVTLETKKERPLILHLPDIAKKLVSCNLDSKPTGKVLEIQLQANKKIELIYKC